LRSGDFFLVRRKGAALEYFDGAIDAAVKGFRGAAFIEHTEKLQARTR
jgi:hypothetical protein